MGALIALTIPLPVQRAAPDIVVTIDRNVVTTAKPDFKFAHVPSPRKDDAAAKATVALVEGEIDPNGAPLIALVDGALPTNEDQPDANFFFNAGTSGGSFRLDLGALIDISTVNTYSWHPNTRGPQVYALYGSDGTGSGFNAAPKNAVDPVNAGWTWIATVDTRPLQGDPGGQYGVSITKRGGALGKYRYLLFVCNATEADDEWGNTFYSEIDVIAKTPSLSRRPSRAR